MATKLQDRPGADRQQPDRPDLGPGHDQSAGKASDPRGENAAAGDASDPRAGSLNAEQAKNMDSSARAYKDINNAEKNPGQQLWQDHANNPASGNAAKAKLQDAEQNGGPKNDGDEPDSYDADDLNDQEEEAGDDSFYSDENNPGGKTEAKGFLRRNKKKAGVAGGIFGGGIIALLIGIFVFLPLKIEHIVTNIMDRFTSPASSAIEAANEGILEHYLRKYVMPAYIGQGCVTTLNRSCKVNIIASGNPVTGLMRSWEQNGKHIGIENTLARDYGVVLSHDVHAGTWRLITPNTGGKGVPIGKNGELLSQEFKKRAEVRSAVRGTFEHESRWKEKWLRYRVGRLLEQKYGLRRCLIFCKVTDPFADKIDEKQKAAKLYLAERVLKPRSEIMFGAVACMLDENCRPDQTQSNEPCTKGKDCELNGSPSSDYEKAQRAKLEELATKYGITSIDELDKTFKDMHDRGFAKFMIEKVLQKVFTVETSQKITDAIPFIGWVNLAFEVINGANDAGPKLKKLAYVTGAASAVALFMEYRSYADEIHTGQADPTELGSFVDSLGTGTDDPNDPIVGGTASAENAPLYDQLVNGGDQPGTTTAFLDNFLPGRASAAVSASADYRCNDGKAPQPGTACPEELLGQGNSAANAIHSFLNSPGIDVITAFAQFWRATIGVLFNFANAALGTVITPLSFVVEKTIDVACTPVTILGHTFYPIDVTPFFGFGHALCVAKEKVEAAAPKIIEAITNWMIPNPFGTNMGGGRTVTELGAGGAAIGKDATEQAGGRRVSKSVYQKIVNQQLADAKEDFDHQPLFARMFSTDSSYSLVSQLAMATPLNLQSSVASDFAGLMANPFSALTDGFGAAFSSGRASAATGVDPDPYHIGTDAFPADEIPADAEQYWNDYCTDDPANAYQSAAGIDKFGNWNQEANDGPVDENTGMPVHRKSNPCLLFKDVTGVSATGDDTGSLDDEDLADVNGYASSGAGAAATPAAAATTPGSLPTGSAQDLATQLKSFIDSGKIKCLNTGCPDIVDTANGTSIKKASCFVDNLDPAILGMLLNLVQAGHTFILSAMCTDHPSNPVSLHHQGKAVDFNTIDGTFMGPDDVPWTNSKIAAAKKLDQDIAAFMPKSTGFGQEGGRCHPSFAFLSSFVTFDDACHHQHVQVP